jgi:hypothetical protein
MQFYEVKALAVHIMIKDFRVRIFGQILFQINQHAVASLYKISWKLRNVCLYCHANTLMDWAAQFIKYYVWKSFHSLLVSGLMLLGWNKKMKMNIYLNPNKYLLPKSKVILLRITYLPGSSNHHPSPCPVNIYIYFFMFILFYFL